MSPIQHASRWRGICVSVILYLAISIYLGLRQIAAGALPEESHVGTGPRYLIDSWQTEDGLPQNSVTCMAQTPDGYFWLGTFNGLVRFDGVRFVVFDAGTTPELASSRIVALHADKQGRLWIQSEFGDLSLLEGGRFKSLRDRWGKVAYPIEDPQGKMWFFRQTAVEQFEHGARIPLTEYDGTDLGWVRDVVCDAHGTFWAVRKRGIGFSQDGHFVFSSSLPAGSEPPDKVAPSRDGGLWVAYKSSGLAKFHAGKPVLEARPFPVIGAGAKVLYEDSRGNVWVGTESNGLFLLTTNGQWEVFNKAGRLSHDSIRVVQEDPEGNIWVGTDGGGLNRLSLRTFAAYGAELGVALTVTEDRQGQLWVGYNGAGIKRLEGGQMQPVSFPPLLGKQGACWSLYADRQGSVWTGDVMGGLVQMGVQGCLHHPNQDANVSPSLKALYEDRSGRLWAGHQPGLLYYTKGQFRRLTREEGLPVDDVRALTEDEEGDLYIGTNGGGLVRRHAGQSQVYTRASGLPDDRVWSLYGDGEGAVWVGTFGSGLGRFSGGKFFNYGEAIPARVVTCIIEDDAGYLWLGSLKGILRVKRSDLNAFAEGRAGAPAFQKYDKTDGLESIECSGGLQPAAWKGRDGRIWFATLKGVAVVDPGRLPLHSRAPTVVLEEARIDGRPADKVVSLAGKSSAIRVPAGSDRLEFRYTAFNFTAPQKIRFRYRMEGLSPHWVEAGVERVVSYIHTSPGSYRFEVTACNQDGVWNESGASVAVVVSPFFWQTKWFLLGVLVLIGGFAGWIIRYFSWQRLQRQVVMLEQRHALDRERARIAHDIHDELGARLTQISLLSELARRRAGDPLEMLAQVEQIASQTHTMAQVMDEIVWAVDPGRDTLENVADYLASFAGEFLGLAGIHCRLEVPASLPGRKVPAPTRHSIFLVAKEALNNVVKHSGATEVWIRLETPPGKLGVAIEDNGRGFPADSPTLRAGNGLGSMGQRVRDLGGEFQMVSKPGRGTRIRLTIPLESQDQERK